MREQFFDTRSIHFRQFWATLVFVAEKPPPTPTWGKIFWHQIYPFQGILSNFGFGGRKATPHPDEGIFFDTRSIHFREFWVTLVLVAEKPHPPPRWGNNFWHQIYPFQAILSNFGFGGRKAHPPQMREKFLTPDLSISGNFKQLWFWWQKRPPRWGKFFDTRYIHFRQFQATLVFVAEKPTPLRWGKSFWHQIYQFQAISSNFGFCGRKACPPPRWGKIFWHQIYPFQAISSNFGFCGRKDHPNEGKFFDTRYIHFRQFQATLVFVAE